VRHAQVLDLSVSHSFSHSLPYLSPCPFTYVLSYRPQIHLLLFLFNWLWAHASARETTHFFPLSFTTPCL
jgi:hypothetical protein